MSATPRPWKVQYRAARPGGVLTRVCAPDDKPVTSWVAQENADLIVRAVNAHDALVEVMRAAERIFTVPYNDLVLRNNAIRALGYALDKAKDVL